MPSPGGCIFYFSDLRGYSRRRRIAKRSDGKASKRQQANEALALGLEEEYHTIPVTGRRLSQPATFERQRGYLLR